MDCKGHGSSWEKELLWAEECQGFLRGWGSAEARGDLETGRKEAANVPEGREPSLPCVWRAATAHE